MQAITANAAQLVTSVNDKELKTIGEKIINRERIGFDEGVLLFEKATLPFAGALATQAS